MRKVLLYIAMSLDGYIAKPNDDLGFLSMVQDQGEDYGYGKFIDSVDTVVVGRKTYDWVLTQVPEFPHTDKESYIITKTFRPTIGNINFYNGSLKELFVNLKSKPGKNIFVDGGAELVNALMQEDLIDEFIISIIPTFLGDGIRLFKNGIPERKLKLVDSKYFRKGLVQLHYTLHQ